jgi:hypothetical protein
MFDPEAPPDLRAGKPPMMLEAGVGAATVLGGVNVPPSPGVIGGKTIAMFYPIKIYAYVLLAVSLA